MEESEKRRERLRAMRMEAEAEVVSSSTCSSSLSNPLLDRPEDDSRSSVSRFGFYTDPMAAFSSDKRRTGQQPQPQPRPPFPPSSSGPQNPEMPISDAHQFQNNYSPYQNMQQPGDHQFQNNYSPYQNMQQPGSPYNTPGFRGSPMGIRSPYPMHQGSPGFGAAPGRGHWFNNNPSPGIGRGGGPYPMHQGSPNFRTPPQGRGHWSNNSPGPPGSGRGGSPSSNMGRGRGWWDGGRMNSGSRFSSGRGRGSDSDGRARSFYDKSMVEDPWESLTPMIWQVMVASGSNLNSRASVQRTPCAKKPKVSGSVDTSNSKQSLAEFLAASFDEAVGDATTAE